MFFTTRKPYLSKHAREITINENSNLPQLFRLCSQYDFAVIGINERSATPKKYRLIEIKQASREQAILNVTNDFESLMLLEKYATNNLVDIIQRYYAPSMNLSA